MPFRSAKQKTWLAINKPEIYKRWKAKYGTKIKGGKNAPKKRRTTRKTKKTRKRG